MSIHWVSYKDKIQGVHILCSYCQLVEVHKVSGGRGSGGAPSSQLSGQDPSNQPAETHEGSLICRHDK